MENQDFDRLARRHRDAVFKQIVRVCGNQDDAEDALTEALLQAYKASSQLRNEEAFKAWVVSIGKRVCIRIRKKDALYAILDPSDQDLADHQTAQDAAERNELKGCIQGAMSALPPIYREVYQMREVEGLPAEEVASELNLSIAAVKSRLHRARKIVREQLDQSICAGSLEH